MSFMMLSTSRLTSMCSLLIPTLCKFIINLETVYKEFNEWKIDAVMMGQKDK